MRKPHRPDQWFLSSVAALLLAIVAFPVGAQTTGGIRGRVVDAESQQPLAEVQVVAGEQRRALTDAAGEYTLVGVPPGSRTIRVQRIGYLPQQRTVTVIAGESTQADFSLRATALQLGEVVTTGTAVPTQQRALGNSVTRIDVSTLSEQTNITNVTEVLQSRTPGVLVSPGSGAPGTAAEIRIRGAGSISGYQPVVYIDGIRYNIESLGNFSATGAGLAGQAQSTQVTSALNFINPEDIESIEVIKGPAAATLYGAEAANGVIQIITKKGQRGERPIQWTARYERGENEWHLDTPFNYTTCDAPKQALPAMWPGCVGVAENTILTDEPMRRDANALRVGDVEQMSISANGGGDQYSFYISGDKGLNQGVYFNSYEDRASLRGNFTFIPTDKADITVNSGYIRSNLRLPYQDESAGAILLSASRGRPGRTSVVGEGWATINPLRSNLYDNTTRSDRFTLGATVNYRPLTWFTNRLTAGMDFTSSLAQLVSGPGQDDALGYSAQRTPRNYLYTLDYAGSVVRALPYDLESTTSIGTQLIAKRYELLSATGTGLATSDVVLIGNATTTVGSNSFSENNSLGYYAQQQFGWRDRLYVTGAVRADDNSAFGENFDIIVYPKFSLSYVLSEEPALESLLNRLRLDELRFRTAWGRAGRAPDPFSASQTYAIQRVTFGGSTGLGLITSAPGNPDLEPELGDEIELGFDAGLLDGRLGFDFTYYDKTTSGMLQFVASPPSGGFTASRLTNLGEVSNSGVELGVSATPLRLPWMEWDAYLTLATNDNELESFGTDVSFVVPTGQAYTPNFQRHVAGHPLGGYWGRMPTLDANGQMQFNAARNAIVLDTDYSYIGPSTPTREIGLGNTFTFFENFRLYAQFDYKGGFYQANYKEYNRCSSNDNCAILNDPRFRFADNVADSLTFAYWRTVPAAYVQKADFIKLRDLSLTYDVPMEYASRLGVRTASVSLAGHNLALWSDYPGFDPEVNSYGGRLFVRADVYAAPMTRRLTASVNLGF